MTESHYKEMQQFALTLSVQRQQVSDQGLLDKCQQYLDELLPLAADGPFEQEPQAAGASQ
jgi:hypothetical protein